VSIKFADIYQPASTPMINRKFYGFEEGSVTFLLSYYSYRYCLNLRGVLIQYTYEYLPESKPNFS